MSHTWKISEAASIALHTMAFLATTTSLLSTREIAERLKVSEAHLSKVLQRLARVDLVKATRGPKGGFVLGRSSTEITLLEVFEAIEGPYVPTNCLYRSPICSGEHCLLGGLLYEVDKQVADYLKKTRLSELTDVYSKTNS